MLIYSPILKKNMAANAVKELPTRYPLSLLFQPTIKVIHSIYISPEDNLFSLEAIGGWPPSIWRLVAMAFSDGLASLP